MLMYNRNGVQILMESMIRFKRDHYSGDPEFVHISGQLIETHPEYSIVEGK